MSLEYNKLVERTAKKIAEDERKKHNQLFPEDKNYPHYSECVYLVQESYKRLAKQILSDESILIKADDQSLPEGGDFEADILSGGWVKTADKGE